MVQYAKQFWTAILKLTLCVKVSNTIKNKPKTINNRIIRLSNSIDDLKNLLNETDNEILEKYWDKSVKNRVNDWIGLIKENTKTLKSINLAEYLKDKFAKAQS